MLCGFRNIHHLIEKTTIRTISLSYFISMFRTVKTSIAIENRFQQNRIAVNCWRDSFCCCYCYCYSHTTGVLNGHPKVCLLILKTNRKFHEKKNNKNVFSRFTDKQLLKFWFYFLSFFLILFFVVVLCCVVLFCACALFFESQEEYKNSK